MIYSTPELICETVDQLLPRKDRNIFLSVDSDNLSPKCLKSYDVFAKKLGTHIIKEVFCHPQRKDTKNLKNAAVRSGMDILSPRQAPKMGDVTDMKMYNRVGFFEGKSAIDVFIIATSDAHFYDLVASLQERGKIVIVIGNSQTNSDFIAVCDIFIYSTSLIPI